MNDAIFILSAKLLTVGELEVVIRIRKIMSKNNSLPRQPLTKEYALSPVLWTSCLVL
jgi:hypothetical protein